MKNLVAYHNNCHDGFMAATLMYLYFKEIGELDVTEFLAVNYNEPIPNVTGRHVYIVDFSYSKEIINEASLIAASITMLDHHLTAAQQWGGYGDYGNGKDIVIKINEHHSGAGLTLNWIRNKILIDNPEKQFEGSLFNYDDYGDRILTVTNAVQDRDLWKFELTNTKEICEALSILDRTFEDWEEFLITSSFDVYEERIKAAGYYLEVKEKLAQEYASKCQLVSFLDYLVPFVNCPANFASRVCEIMYKDYPFSVSYCLSTDTVFVSLRSSSESGVDVSEIAKMFLGGGHKNAAGFKISTKWIYYFLSSQHEYVRLNVNPGFYSK